MVVIALQHIFDANVCSAVLKSQHHVDILIEVFLNMQLLIHRDFGVFQTRTKFV